MWLLCYAGPPCGPGALPLKIACYIQERKRREIEKSECRFFFRGGGAASGERPALDRGRAEQHLAVLGTTHETRAAAHQAGVPREVDDLRRRGQLWQGGSIGAARQRGARSEELHETGQLLRSSREVVPAAE